MSNVPAANSPPAPARRGKKIAYVVTILLTAGATFGVMLLWQNIQDRKEEARQQVFKVVDVGPEEEDPAVWGQNFPRQYDGYKRTAENRFGHGGSEAEPPPQKKEDFPSLPALYEGYPFSVDFRHARGHAFMLSDQDQTKRTTEYNQFGACLHCHASLVKLYHERGRKAGVGDDKPREQLMAGFKDVCAMSLKDARKLVSHPVACIDCHDAKTMQLRVTRPGFLNGIAALAANDKVPTPHLPSIESWRKRKTGGEYDPNEHASRQEMRSLVCGQCHVEYYFTPKGKIVTYPWNNGLLAGDIEKYYSEGEYKENRFKDWVHPRTGAEMLKAQHPEFEMWSQGVHARSKVSCADCHMPYLREGAVKVSDHQVRSPMHNIAASCQTCHRHPEDELRARVDVIQGRTKDLVKRGEKAVVALIEAIEAAKKAGVPDDKLKAARDLHRAAQWRLDFVLSENSLGFHAPQESARVLAEALDLARQGQVEAVRARIP